MSCVFILLGASAAASLMVAQSIWRSHCRRRGRDVHYAMRMLGFTFHAEDRTFHWAHVGWFSRRAYGLQVTEELVTGTLHSGGYLVLKGLVRDLQLRTRWLPDNKSP